MSELTVNIELSPIAQLLRRKRIEKGLTIVELGTAVKIPVSRLTMFECGNATPTKKELKLLQKFYGVEIK